MKVVVTGGAGFIGSNLVRHLASRPSVVQVVALDDLSAGQAQNLDGIERTSLVVGSILDRSALDRTVRGADVVVHLAARGSVPRSLTDPLRTNLVNVDGTLAVLESVRANAPQAQVIFASSSSVYGANPIMPKHEDMTVMPMSPYAVSKLAGEQYLLAYARSFELRVLPFRLFNVYGPLQTAGHAYAAVVPAFIDAALHRRPLPIYGDGLQTRDFTFVGTVVEVLGRCITEGLTSAGPVNLAFGTRRSLMDVVVMLEELLGATVQRQHLPSRLSDVRDSNADHRRLCELLPGLEAVPMELGLAHTLAWMQMVYSSG